MPTKLSLREKLQQAMAANDAPAETKPSDVIDLPRRGRRLNAKQIADEFYGGHVSPDWVLAKVPYRERVRHKTVLWWEYDVIAHLEKQRSLAVAEEQKRFLERQAARRSATARRARGGRAA